MVLIIMDQHQIALLIEKYALGTINADELRTLMEWYRSADTREVVWPDAEIGERERLRSTMLARLNKHVHAKPARVFSLVAVRAAAILVIVVGLAVVGYYFTKESSSQYYTVTNTPGKVQLVQLPDSSRVWLNASSTLRYHKSFNKHRRLELEGEAFFEVTKDPDHAFQIRTGEMITTVVGTSFNVSAWKDAEWKSVSVVTGKMRVNNEMRELAVLTPAKTLRYNPGSDESTILETDTSGIKSWTRGKFQFNGSPLSEITSVLGRWYGYSFTFDRAEIESCRYYLNLSNSLTIDEVIHVLREVAGLEININHSSKSISVNGTSCQ